MSSLTHSFFFKQTWLFSFPGGKELQTENLGKENVGSGHKHRVMPGSLMKEEEAKEAKGTYKGELPFRIRRLLHCQ